MESGDRKKKRRQSRSATINPNRPDLRDFARVRRHVAQEQPLLVPITGQTEGKLRSFFHWENNKIASIRRVAGKRFSRLSFIAHGSPVALKKSNFRRPPSVRAGNHITRTVAYFRTTSRGEGRFERL